MQQPAGKRPLLTTKLTIPSTYLKNYIARPRLYERLEKVTRGACTLLAAPAGFGKTSLVSAWLHTYHPSAHWVTLDANDNEPARFTYSTISALSQSEPTIADTFKGWLDATLTMSNETILTTLINTLTDIPHDILLVLDDYQYITNDAIHQIVTFLLEHQPTHFHLIILSRSNPPLPLARLRVKGLLNELRVQDLRFTPDETVALLNKVTGLILYSQDIAMLDWHIEGWAAGLQLAALSLQRFTDQEEAMHFIRSYNGENQHITRYLTQEVLDRQPESVLRFLYTTSILDSFTANLCNAVTTYQNAQEILAYLSRQGLFLTALNTQEGWYRYHRPFRILLQQRLKQRQAGEIAQMHTRASSWYEEQGYYAEAITHALKASNMEHAIELIEKCAVQYIRQYKIKMVESWLVMLLTYLNDKHPLISYLRACIYLLRASYPEYEKAIQHAEEIWHKEQNYQMLSQVYATRAYGAIINYAGMQAIEHAQKALELAAGEDTQVYASATVALGIGYQLLGDITQASPILVKGYHLSLKSYQSMQALIAIIHLAEILASEGKLNEAIQSLQQELLARGDESGFIVHLRLCELYREWNDVTNARVHWQQAMQLIDDEPAQKFLLAEICLTGARLTWMQGQYEEALQQLDEAERYPQIAARNRVMQAKLTASRIQILLSHDKLDEALSWMRVHPPPVQESPLIDEQEAWAATLARLHLAQQHYQQALDVLEAPIQKAHEQGRKASTIKLLVLRAIAYQAQEIPSQAFQNLHYALTLARVGGYIRTFLDEGAVLGKLLNDYYQSLQKRMQNQQQTLQHNYLHNLLAAFHPEIQTRHWNHTDTSTVLSQEKLSGRERKVLQMIAHGLSNQEIADDLHVSISTIKTHLNNIYAKLRVHTRLQAVTKAYDLGIITRTLDAPNTTPPRDPQ